MTKQKKIEPEIEEKLIRIVWGSPDNVPIHYANQISISYAGRTEFHITFGHIAPPYEGFDVNELPEKITVKPIVTIVTSPDSMRAFVQTFIDNLTDFERILEERNKE